jgi:hypothetical protein
MPLVDHLAVADWTRFGSLTFDDGKVTPRLRLWLSGERSEIPPDVWRMWFAYARQCCRATRSGFRESQWCLRIEAGRLGRGHLHFLSDWALLPGECSARWCWGRSDVQAYNPALAGADYVCKCLSASPRIGLEVARFSGLWCGVTLSTGFVRGHHMRLLATRTNAQDSGGSMQGALASKASR